MFNIYIDICLSIEFEFVYSNFSISFEGDDANESYFNKEERKVEKNSVLDFVYSLSIYEYL